MNIPRVVVCLLLAGLLLHVAPARAQADGEDDGAAGLLETSEVLGAAMSAEEAERALATPLPPPGAARAELLRRQYLAAQRLVRRDRMIEVSRELVTATEGAEAERWITTYLNTEYSWGSSGTALAACEAYIGDARLSVAARASVALRQAYFAANTANDRPVLLRMWSRADGLVNQARAQLQGTERDRLQIDWLQTRAEVESARGDFTASVATLREAVGTARQVLDALRGAQASQHEVLEAFGRLDGSMGMLSYALVRQNRPQEAVVLAQASIANWRAGRASDAVGARWNYRLANALNAIQQFEAALAAGRLSDELLQRAGSSPASATRWYARREIVRALLGLRRWGEADEAYRSFLGSMPADTIARTRASDWRFNVLLAAKNGRADEALESVERIHRFRVRLYGPRHPQVQEAAGVRGVVHLARGDLARALPDYETLFAAVLDQRSGWADLDTRGVRGYVFGIAFDEFLRHIAQQAQRGAPPDDAVVQRAFQLADRVAASSTQRALADSTARVLAGTPQLRDQLEQEQVLRQKAGTLFGRVAALLGDEDRLRRDTQTEAFKALPEEERKAHADRLRAVREQIRVQQTEAGNARNELTALRERIAESFPAYADLVTPLPPRPAALASSLQRGEALLAIHPTENATLLWLIRPDAPVAFAASPLGAQALAQRVAELRRMLDLASVAPGTAPPALQIERLHALYRELLGPLHARLDGVTSLVVATQHALAGLPWAALVTEPPAAGAPPAWLLRRMAVSQVPTASALQALRRSAPARVASRALLGFGDPSFSTATAAPARAGQRADVAQLVGAAAYDAERGFRYANMPPLPETRDELRAVAAALGADPARDLVLGEAATRAAVLGADLSDRRVVAFATHALLPGELPGVSKPALAMAAPRDERESPLLELDDVLGLRLNAQWVLLSACNTAAGELGGGAMSGLVRGFFFAGARSVLATHWAVESASASVLSSGAVSAQSRGGASRGEGLRQAQLAMADGTNGDGRWRHPFYWAPFALFGDPAR